MANKGSSGGGGGSGAVRAGRAFVELFAEDSRLRRGLDAAANRVKAFGLSLAKAGGIALGAGLVGGAIVDKLVGGFTKSAVEVGRFGTRIGEDAEKLSAFLYAAETTGQTMQDVAGHFENLAERVLQGAEGTGEAANVFKKLNIDAKELIRLSPVDRILAIADAMEKLPKGERGGVLSQLGSDQFQGMNELLLKGSAGIKALMAEAGLVGATFSAEQIKEAAAAEREMHKATTALSASLAQLGQALMPSAEFFAMLSGTAVAASTAIRGWLAAERDAVAVAGDAADGLAGVGAGIVAVGVAAIVAAVGFKALIALVGFALSPLGLFTIAVAGLTYAALQTEEGAAAIGKIGRYATESATTFSAAWGGIKTALQSGDLALAGRIAMAGLNVEWQRGLSQMTDGWRAFSDHFKSGWAGAAYMFKLSFSDMIYDATKSVIYAEAGIKQTIANLTGGTYDPAPQVAHLRAVDRVQNEMQDRLAREHGEENERIKRETNAALAARQAELAAAKAELAAAVAQAADDAAMREWIKSQLDMGPQQVGGLAKSMGLGGSRGMFSFGASAAQAFANPSGSPVVVELKKGNAIQEKIRDGVAALAGNALVFTR